MRQQNILELKLAQRNRSLVESPKRKWKYKDKTKRLTIVVSRFREEFKDIRNFLSHLKNVVLNI